jgi:hypothetical protein
VPAAFAGVKLYMNTNLRDFISNALCYTSDSMSYEVTRKLTDMFPERAVIDTETDLFDLLAYERGGQCYTVNSITMFNKYIVDWIAKGKALEYAPENAWLNVLWREQMIDVLILTWLEEGYKESHYWIIADSKETAERFLQAVCEWTSEVHGEILVFDGGYWSKNDELFHSIKAANFENMILPAALKQEIQDDFARFFAAREIYKKYEIPWKRGVLFIGPPGNGKTHAVKALINRLNKPCLYVKSFKSCYGNEHDIIRKVFVRARKTTPCLVVLEDLDALIDKHNRSFFLNEMDGFAANTGVVVLATTNYPEKLDSAILDRPSRFDRKYYFRLPAAAERLAYIEMWNGTLETDLRLSENAIPQVVEQTEGFSFAYMKELFLSAMMEWIVTPKAGKMDKVMLARAEVLRSQMKAKDKKAGKKAKSKTAQG